MGGDYYDFLGLGGGRVAFVLADIAGKGISAALLMANLQASLRSLYLIAGEDLPRLLHAANALFVRNTEVTHYATVFYGVYDDVSRKLMYANWGIIRLFCCGRTARWNGWKRQRPSWGCLRHGTAQSPRCSSFKETLWQSIRTELLKPAIEMRKNSEKSV